MRTLIVLAVLIVSACGADCDFVTSGLCVVTNGYAIKTRQLDAAITLTQDHFNDDCSKGIDLVSLLDEYGVTMEFVEQITDKGKHPLGIYNTGTYDIGIEYNVYFATSDDPMVLEHTMEWRTKHDCIEMYRVVGHEVLHFIAQIVLDETDRNYDHSVPGFWSQGGDYNTIEAKVRDDMYYYCSQQIVNPPADGI
jgi:hypothetical protein